MDLKLKSWDFNKGALSVHQQVQKKDSWLLSSFMANNNLYPHYFYHQMYKSKKFGVNSRQICNL